MSRRSGRRDPDLLSMAVVAKMLGLDPDVGRETIRAYAQAGKIQTVEIQPGVFRIARDEVERLQSAIH